MFTGLEERKTRQNRNLYELLMSVKSMLFLSLTRFISISSYSVFSLPFATFFILAVCPRHVLSIQTAESFLWKGRQTHSYNIKLEHIIRRYPLWWLINRQLVFTQIIHLLCVTFLIQIQPDSECLKVVLVGLHFKSLLVYWVLWCCSLVIRCNTIS